MFLGSTVTPKPFNEQGLINHGPNDLGKPGIPSQELAGCASCGGDRQGVLPWAQSLPAPGPRVLGVPWEVGQPRWGLSTPSTPC